MTDLPRASGGSPPPGHVPVLLREVLHYLALDAGQIVVDGTVGAGGHSRAILPQIGSTGVLIGLDRDPHMLHIAARALPAENCHLIQSSYADLEQVLAGRNIHAADRVLLDLGLSSVQLADEGRGFGFHSAGALDLRFDVSQGEPAWALVARSSEDELADIIERYGEEPHSRKIARKLVAVRSERPITTARELAEAVASAGAARAAAAGARHPATRVFQALRIAVNQELEQLERALADQLYKCLKPGGIAVIISFHSLEDRLVKQSFRDSKSWQILTPKPVTATNAEQRLNPRSRTAKLRAATRL